MATGIPALLSGFEGTNITTLRPVSFARQDQASFDETLLQRVIDETPAVLPIRDYYPAITSVCSLGREIPVDLGEKQGFIDNLLVTNDGHLVLVETKLYRNPEAVREVVIQTLQYSMAVNKMPLLELESRIRRGNKKSSLLKDGETIRGCVFSMAERGLMKGLSDNFEEALEHYQRTGEMLLLVVADGIHTSVERIVQWMNEQGNSTPIKFGLVELRFYALPNGERVVVPKTLLRTREISRHVVVVDIRGEGAATATAKVVDEFRTPSGGTVKETRAIKPAQQMLTKPRLMEQISPSAMPIVTSLIDQLEFLGLDQNNTTTYLRYGVTFPAEGGEFYPLIYLSKTGIWSSLPKRIATLLGNGGMLEYRQKVNGVGVLYHPDKISNANAEGSEVKYETLGSSIQNLIGIIEEYKLRVLSLLKEQTEQ